MPDSGQANARQNVLIVQVKRPDISGIQKADATVLNYSYLDYYVIYAKAEEFRRKFTSVKDLWEKYEGRKRIAKYKRLAGKNTDTSPIRIEIVDGEVDCTELHR